MLPILRIIPVGGVFLAIMIVVLAFEPPGSPRPLLTPARGALIAAEQHPEWRQFLIQAALRRADELGRLRELPDTPMRTEAAPEPAEDATTDASQVAVLPLSRAGSDPDDQTGTISETPGMTIPVDIGESSAFELPVAAPEEKPPVPKTPLKATSESRKKTQRVRRTTATRTPPPAAQLNLFEAFFSGSQHNQQPAAPSAPLPATERPDAY